MMGVSVGLFSSAFLPKAASAATSDPRLLLVELRGGMDGVNVVVPHGDPSYVSMRGAIAIDRAATQNLDGFFGLNSAMPAFGAMYRSGEALAALNELDLGLSEFRAYGPRVWRDTVVVMATEFGRTVRVNGDKGTDHGVGTVTLLAGGAVAGGRVLGDWPGLVQKNLLDASDLKATTDLRAIFKGVLADHVGVLRKVLDETVFPDSAEVKPMAGLVRAPASARSPGADASAVAAFAPAEAAKPMSPIARYRAVNGV